MIAVEEPLNCPNVSKIACKYAAIFQEFLQHSELPIWNRLNNTGFWRQLTVSFQTTSMMVKLLLSFGTESLKSKLRSKSLIVVMALATPERNCDQLY